MGRLSTIVGKLILGIALAAAMVVVYYQLLGLQNDFLYPYSWSANARIAVLHLHGIATAVVVAVLFSYPVVRLYSKHPLIAATLICIPTIDSRLGFLLDGSGRTFFVSALVLEIIALLFCMLWASWLLHMRSLRSNNSFKRTAAPKYE